MTSVTRDMADAGWLVEVILVTPNNQPDSRFFAVGIPGALEAEEAVLRYPGLLSADRRIARRRLSPKELSDFALRPQAVRPYGVRACAQKRDTVTEGVARVAEEELPKWRPLKSAASIT